MALATLLCLGVVLLGDINRGSSITIVSIQLCNSVLILPMISFRPLGDTTGGHIGHQGRYISGIAKHRDPGEPGANEADVLGWSHCNRNTGRFPTM